MSERGSWITEYIYCSKCAEQFRRFLIETGAHEPNKYWSGLEIVPGAIFAGRIGGLYSGEEPHAWEELQEKLRPMLCHPIRVAVIPESESAQGIYKVDPFEKPWRTDNPPAQFAPAVYGGTERGPGVSYAGITSLLKESSGTVPATSPKEIKLNPIVETVAKVIFRECCDLGIEEVAGHLTWDSEDLTDKCRQAYRDIGFAVLHALKEWEFEGAI